MSENFIKTDLIYYLLISTLILLMIRKFIPLYMICNIMAIMYHAWSTCGGINLVEFIRSGTNTIMTTLPVVLHAKNS